MYPGLLGVKYLLEGVRDTLTQLPDPQSILDQQLDVKAKTLSDSLGTFYTNFKDQDVESATTPSKRVKPSSISTLTQKINEPIGTEVDGLVAVSN